MTAVESAATIHEVDLAETSLRELNAALHADGVSGRWRVLNPRGAHALAVGIDTAARGARSTATWATTARA